MATVDPAEARVIRPETVGPAEGAASSSDSAALCEFVLETQASERYFRSWLELLARGLASGPRAAIGSAENGSTRWLRRRILKRAQRRAERFHSGIRRQLLETDEQLASLLAFSGRGE